MNFFYFLSANKSKFQKLNKSLNLGNNGNTDINLALEKLRERNLNVFSKLYYDFRDAEKFKSQNLSKEYLKVELDNIFYQKKYYKNINKLSSYTNNNYSYSSNSGSIYYNLIDLKNVGSLSFLNYANTLTVDDFNNNIEIYYGGYVSSLISRSFSLNSFFNIRKRNVFNNFNQKLKGMLGSDILFFRSNNLFRYYFYKNFLFDDLNIKNNSLLQKFDDLNNIYDFLYSQKKNNKNFLKKKSIYSNYGMFKKYINFVELNKNNFRSLSRFFYSLSNFDISENFESFFLSYNLKKEHRIKNNKEFLLIKNSLNYCLSSFLLSNYNIYKGGLISKLFLFNFFKLLYVVNISNFGKDNKSKFSLLKFKNNFLFNKFYLLSLVIFSDRRYFDGLKPNQNILIFNNYLNKII